MYSLRLQVLVFMQTKITFTSVYCLNSYNWPFEGNHNADMALGENEFDAPDIGERLRFCTQILLHENFNRLGYLNSVI